MWAKVFNKTAKNYDLWYEKEGLRPFLSELIALFEALKPFSDPERLTPALEIGAGTGRFSWLFGAFSLDPSIEMLKIARKRSRVIRGLCEKLPFKTESFGLVFMITTLCFVKEKELCLSECRRVLKKTGTLLIGFINSESRLGKLYKEKADKGHPIYREASFLTLKEVIHLLEKTGFSIYKVVSIPRISEFKVRKPIIGADETADFIVIRAF